MRKNCRLHEWVGGDGKKSLTIKKLPIISQCQKLKIPHPTPSNKNCKKIYATRAEKLRELSQSLRIKNRE